MLNTILAASGIDGVQIDAVLDQDTVDVGDKLTGRLCIQGGRTNQQIRQLEAVLACDAVHEANDEKIMSTAVLKRTVIDGDFTIEPGQKHELPFSLTVPPGTPVDVPLRSSKAGVYVLSAADVALAVDSKDCDRVRVRPTQTHEAVRAVMGEEGFRFHEGEVEMTRHGPIQEFEFVPQQRGGKLGKIEIAFIPEEQGYALAVETELSNHTGLGMLSSVLDVDLDERKHLVRLPGGVDGPDKESVRDGINRCLAAA